MARTLLDLANDVDKLGEKIAQSASDHAVKTALTIVGDLVYHTPVDTSQALSNWDVTIGAPATDPHGPYAAGKHGSTQQQSAARALAQAKETLKDKKPGQTIYIANNLPYIRRLNEGHSQQVPAGFVERALLLGRKMKAKFKLRK
ncbi:putative tail completion protein [Xanthomonas phage Pfeifenkraut]|uniref:Tail completion protein n=1 Tax=Xanthomonas phage Pfeifenkraut TaxID=2939132 RepID=A0A9E7E346_9CAUD|nr:putative tail completion protein [Xanthomonas phage Pfeifenkraut]URA06915.1 putative tail completion protein [Xanthomonas phage Pfeifenkraut]